MAGALGGEPPGGPEDEGAGCRCGRCPQGARAGHRHAVAAFVALREEFAAGRGVPAGLARSAGAARQWVSDELSLSAQALAERSAGTETGWLVSVRRGTLAVVWGGVAALLLGQALTAIGTGWTVHRTAGLIAAVVAALGLTATAWRHRAHGGVLAPLVGEDRRLSTSRTVAAGWLGIVVYAVLVAGVRVLLEGAGGGAGARVGAGAGFGGGGWSVGRGASSGQELLLAVPALLVPAVVYGVAVTARVVVGARVRTGRLQKPAAACPRAVDLLADDAGRGSLADAQYLVVNAAVAAFALVSLAAAPEALLLSWGPVLLVAVSAAGYLAGKCTEGGRPVILSVVRARELGDLAAPVRTGDDIEIRGAGFLPPGARTPDRLAQVVVRIGAVHVPVPLVPVPGGFVNPADGTLTVPVPADVEPGRAEVRVITAAGVETDAYVIEVQE
ncbi:hypothetical protein [Streptomyces pinistramenti]|uniref:hypothetical protein n=1 Tax=Streptomyces pinistramenti TaxID=2884812 RepID=UPI001D071075|nr:hypothetical protein [Streptomyces pinistramenti]MCB5911184.1 hypothetical protein [Streptomyces pinistramenti]